MTTQDRTAIPRFDRPAFARPADEVLGAADATVPAQRPLPALDDPPPSPVLASVDEPLVPVEHRRIRVLSNYWHAGWGHAVPGAWLRAGAMTRLGECANALPEPYGLAVFDAWRPLVLQSELWHAAYDDPGLPPGFVADPNPDPRTPPPHLTGGTVDLTLTYEGTPLALGTDFDDFRDVAATAALEDVPGVDRELRRMLFWAMHAVGFVVLHCEWWHFEYGTRRWAALTGRSPLYGPASLP